MKRKVLAAIVIAMGMLAGCGGNDENSSVVHTVEGQPIADETQQAGGQQTAGGETITERTVVDGQMQSYLTGEWKDEEVVKGEISLLCLSTEFPGQALFMRLLWRDA